MSLTRLSGTGRLLMAASFVLALCCYHPPQICHRTLVPVLPAVQGFRAVTGGMLSAVMTVAAWLEGVVTCG